MEYLRIQNITKLVGSEIKGKILYSIDNHTNTLGEDAYVFKFTAAADGEGWNKEKHVHLVRVPKSGRGTYELFLMGLHVGTCIDLELKDIKDIRTFNNALYKVLDTAHNWWQNK